MKEKKSAVKANGKYLSQLTRDELTELLSTSTDRRLQQSLAQEVKRRELILADRKAQIMIRNARKSRDKNSKFALAQQRAAEALERMRNTPQEGELLMSKPCADRWVGLYALPSGKYLVRDFRDAECKYYYGGGGCEGNSLEGAKGTFENWKIHHYVKNAIREA